MLLLVALQLLQVAAQNVDVKHACIKGSDFQLPIQLEDLCLTFRLETCQHYSLFINVSYGNTVLFDWNVPDVKEAQECRPVEGTPCTTCLGFKTLDIKPGFAHMCPKVVTTCEIITGLPIRTTQYPRCVELGQDCGNGEATSCETCVDSRACGWCGASQRCMPRGPNNGPWCGTCNHTTDADGRSQPTWVTQCAKPVTWLANKAPIVVGISVTSGVLFVAVVIGVCVVRKRSADLTKQYSVQRRSSEYEGPVDMHDVVNAGHAPRVDSLHVPLATAVDENGYVPMAMEGRNT